MPLIAAPGLSGPRHAMAQDQNVRSLQDRVDRMERDLNQVQRQVYRGGAAAPGGAVPAQGDNTAALNAEIRMDQLENQMRQLTGKLEEVQYGIDQLKSRMDKQQADDEVRFGQLEHPDNPAPPAKGGKPPVGAAAPGPAPSTSAAPSSAASPGAGNPQVSASASGTLGTMPVGPAGAAPPAPSAPASAPAGLSNGSAQDQYNYAFTLLRQSDYAGAEQALKAFLQKHPTDALAGNAQYWLGESYFARKDFQSAAAAFAEGYQKYPQSAKSSDNLLKLGISLGNVGRKQDACFSFARLERDFPNMNSTMKDRESQEKQRLGCS
ncbi:MAG TPA: tol-pal system protein YbgF [Stellaceae bacterium]|nr:tol-pal system protein YbgF [Stellaceae bacterium]